LGGFCDRRVVVLHLAEIEKDPCVVDVPRELVDGLEALLDGGAPPRVPLGLLRVVPETRGERRVGERFEFCLQPWDVKETPLAP
jgi:hypothetical protein